ncbi:MAG: terminase large subunit domain-containing protein, partial [Terriglobia bacterium]
MRKKQTKTRKRKAGDPQLYPYQRRWVEDESRFKIACKARQIGMTFAAAWRVMDKRLEKPGTTLWLSASERQALEAMEHVRRFAQELGVVALQERSFVEGTSVKQHQVRFPNGSRIVALPANPDTVRGFAGDVVLDEFAFHRDAEAIWRAAFATATRGFQLEIISTPNGARGKYYELAKAAGLVDFNPAAGAAGLDSKILLQPSGPSHSPVAARNALGPAEAGPHSSSAFPKQTDDESRRAGFIAATRSSPVIPSPAKRDEGSAFSASIWSPHRVDLPTARAQGFVVDVESLRAAIGDEDAWQQEYCCRFLSDAAHYIPPELVVAAEHPAATTTPPFLPVAGARGLDAMNLAQAPAAGAAGLDKRFASYELPVTSNFFLGVDIGRRRDLTVL